MIERPHKKCRVTIHAARPGVIIGKKGADIEKLRKKLAKMTDSEMHLNIVEVRKPEIDAKLVAQGDRPAARAPRRVPPRHEARGAVGDASRRRRHPDQLRAAVSAAPKSRAWNGTAKAACRCTRCAPTSTTARPKRTTAYGIIGVKVWIFKGEILEHDPMASERRATEGDHAHGGGRDRRRENA